MIANQRTVPAAPATGRAPVVELTVEGFGEIRETATALAAAWRPAAQGRLFVWRGVIERAGDALLYQAAPPWRCGSDDPAQPDARRGTAQTRPSDAGALAGRSATSWPGRGRADGSGCGTLDPVDAARTRQARVHRDRRLRGRGSRAAGVTWSAIPRSGTLPACRRGLAGLAPGCADAGGLLEQISGLSWCSPPTPTCWKGTRGRWPAWLTCSASGPRDLRLCR